MIQLKLSYKDSTILVTYCFKNLRHLLAHTKSPFYLIHNRELEDFNAIYDFGVAGSIFGLSGSDETELTMETKRASYLSYYVRIL